MRTRSRDSPTGATQPTDEDLRVDGVDGPLHVVAIFPARRRVGCCHRNHPVEVAGALPLQEISEARNGDVEGVDHVEVVMSGEVGQTAAVEQQLPLLSLRQTVNSVDWQVETGAEGFHDEVNALKAIPSECL